MPMVPTRNPRSVWPDGTIKIAQILAKTCPKSRYSGFYLKRDGFQQIPKRHSMFGQLLLEEFVTKTFKK